MNPHAYYQLRHLLSNTFQWNDHQVTTRLVTINTKEVAHAITPELTKLWATRFNQFIAKVVTLQVDRTTRKLALSTACRNLLTDIKPVIELSTTNHVHLHFVSWEVDGESAFDLAPKLRRQVDRAARQHLAMASINRGQASKLLTVVNGDPKFDRHGQSSVIRAHRYTSGDQSYPLPRPDPPKTARIARSHRLIDQHVTKVATSRSLIEAVRQADIGNCCMQARIDDEGSVTVEASRVKPVYRRTPNLIQLIHELNLLGRVWDFADPAFVNLFDPFGTLAKASQSVLDRRPIDLSTWTDRGHVFATLYSMRGSQRCLIPIRHHLENMDRLLFRDTHASGEFHNQLWYWDATTPIPVPPEKR